MADDPMSAALEEIRTLTITPTLAMLSEAARAARKGYVPYFSEPEVDAADHAASATDRARARLLAAVDVLLKPHRRSPLPAWGQGTGDCHGKHFCIGCSIDGIYREFPCQPYQDALDALTEGKDHA